MAWNEAEVLLIPQKKFTKCCPSTVSHPYMALNFRDAEAPSSGQHDSFAYSFARNRQLALGTSVQKPELDDTNLTPRHEKCRQCRLQPSSAKLRWCSPLCAKAHRFRVNVRNKTYLAHPTPRRSNYPSYPEGFSSIRLALTMVWLISPSSQTTLTLIASLLCS